MVINSFWNDMTSISALIGGATVLCFSFTGFDALSSLAEETKDAEKRFQKRFSTALLAGIIFIVSTYFIQLYFLATQTSILNH